MSRCSQCRVEVKDNTKVCPLCHCVLEQTDAAGKPDMYPSVKKKQDLFNLVIRIYAFLAIVVQSLLVIVNYLNFHGTWWCIITGAAFLYLFLTMRYTVYSKEGYKVKTVFQTIFAVTFVISLDYALGYRGWSMNYVLPAALIVVDVGVIVLMIVNYRNWQSYITFQIFMILCSIAPLVLYGVHIVEKPLWGFVAIGFSVVVFLGTLIVGGSRARRELKRRFHI